MKSLELVDIGRRIKNREDGIEALEKQTNEKAMELLCEINLQGSDLIAARGRCEHGKWLIWLAEHCPKISYEKAKRYMRVAANWSRVNELKPGSLRQALAICDAQDGEGKERKPTKTWPAYIEALGRATKFVGFIERCPLVQWPEEGKARLMEELRPIAEQLWPDAFETEHTGVSPGIYRGTPGDCPGESPGPSKNPGQNR